MRRILLTVFTLGATGLAVPAAHAASPDVIHGGCAYTADDDTNNLSSAPDKKVGVIYDVSATTDATGAPIAATVTCWLDVNGSEAPGTRFSYSGTGVQAGANPVTFTASYDASRVDLCYSVLFGDNTRTGECIATTDEKIPAQVFWDALDVASAAGCLVLPLLPGTYGPVTIGPDGDVYLTDPLDVGFNPIYNCRA